MKCLEHLLKYMGKIGRTLNIRYKEQTHSIRNKNSISGYSNHKHRAYIWNSNIYYGCHNERKEGQTFKYLGKVSHLGKKEGQLAYERYINRYIQLHI
jgi:hypothetical protein